MNKTIFSLIILLADFSLTGAEPEFDAAFTGNRIGGQWITADPAKASERAVVSGRSENVMNP